MMHVPAHKNTQHPAGQIRPNEDALQARRHELFGIKVRRADQIARAAIKRENRKSAS